MSSRTALRPRRVAPTRPLTNWLPMLIAVAIGAGGLTALWGAFDAPSTVDIEIVNPTRRDIHLSVRGEGDDGVVGIGTVGPGDTYRFGEVVEPGDAWIFVFSSAGVEGRELRLTRDQLADGEWTVTVPTAVDRELAGLGVPASP